MSFFKKIFGEKNKKLESEKFDVNIPVENPELINVMNSFIQDKSENNLSKFINELLKANFLVLSYNDEMEVERDGKNTVIKQNSKLKFLNCFNEDGEAFLPLFTDWKEVNVWLKEPDKNIGGFVMDTFEAFEFVKLGENYNGVVINPGSKPWTMNNEQINNFLEDFKK